MGNKSVYKISYTIATIISITWSMFLTFKILEHINATELMWFLYWIFIPIVFTAGVISSIVKVVTDN